MFNNRFHTITMHIGFFLRFLQLVLEYVKNAESEQIRNKELFYYLSYNFMKKFEFLLNQIIFHSNNNVK